MGNLQFPKKPDFHFLNSPLRSTGGERIIFCDAFHSYGLHQIAYLVGFSFFLGQGCFSSVSCPSVSPSFSAATGFAMAGAVRGRVFRRFPVLLCHHPFLWRLDSQWQAPPEDVFFVGFLSFCVNHPFLRRLDSQWQAPAEDVFFVGFLSFCVTIL